MKLTDIYSVANSPTEPDTQPVATPASGARDTTPKAAPADTTHAVTISWVGLVLALVLLRIVYEVSE